MAEEQQQQPPFILSFAPLLGTMPVSLDETTSVNLAKICSYQASEIDILDKNDKPTGKTELKPCIYFGETDLLVLSEEQNKVFKFYWNIYTRACMEILKTVSQIFPVKPAPIGGEQQTGGQQQ